MRSEFRPGVKSSTGAAMWSAALRRILLLPCIVASLGFAGLPAFAQVAEQAPAAAALTAAPEPLSDEELAVLVARIALYPDELVALVSAASLFPLQIVEADRFLDRRKADPKSEPK